MMQQHMYLLKRRRSAAFSVIVCAIISAPFSAAADNLFLVQLGLFSTQEGAVEQLSTVQQNHSELLDGNRYIIRKSRSISGGDASWRVLVGPFDNRRNANRNCAELKSSGADCFVVETAAVNVDDFEGAAVIAGNAISVNEGDAENTLDAGTISGGGANSSDSNAARSGSRLLPWNWFDGGQGNSESTNIAAEPEGSVNLENIALSDAAQEGGGNININTRSVYAENKGEVSAAGPDIAGALSDLFGFGGDASESTLTETTPEVPAVTDELSVAAPVVNPVVNVVVPDGALTSPVLPTLSEANQSIAPVAAEPTQQLSLTPDMTADLTPVEPEVLSGEVEVAEAIQVPLAEPENVAVTVSETPADVPKLLDIQIPSPEELDNARVDSQMPELEAVQDEVVATTKAIEPSVAEPSAATILPSITETPALPEQTAAPANIAVPSQPSMKVSAPDERKPILNFATAPKTSRLLQISVFNNDREAFACISQVQAAVPRATTLRTRLIKSTIGQAVVRLGPVNDSNLEAQICDAASRCGPELRCRVLTEQRPRQASVTESDEASDTRTPVDMSPRSAGMGTDSTDSTASAGSTDNIQANLLNRPVWIQLGTSSSESNAQDKFDSLSSQHPDLLGAYSPVINSPKYRSLAGEVYRLRIGPFEQRREAQNLCATLSSRGVGCLILSR